LGLFVELPPSLKEWEHPETDSFPQIQKTRRFYLKDFNLWVSESAGKFRLL